MAEYQIIATLDKYPYQGIQAVIDKLYLWNPDAANALIEQLNQVIQSCVQEVLGSGNIIVTRDGTTIRITDSTFVFNMASPQTEWIIVHNLNKHPAIDVVDSSGSVIWCKKEFIDDNTVKITCNHPFTGKAYLN